MSAMTDVSIDPKEMASELGAAANAPVGTAVGIASIALNMAMKYHDINTVQDGALYQQYKIEGRNLRDLHLDDVFETAMRIERHLITANERVAKIVFDAVEEVLDAPEESDTQQPKDNVE